MGVRELDETPSLLRLYAKAAVNGLRGGGELPQEELVVRDLAVDRDHLASYDRVCGFRYADTLPPTYPHLLAFPLAMELMARSDFPFSMVGLVHIENRIEQRRPIRADERLDVAVRLRDLRSHPKGRQFDAVHEVSADGETVWTETSIYLRRGGGEGSDGGGDERPSDEPPPKTALWDVPADIGRRYAAVSGDRNPIHLHPLTAKLFGFPRQIAHGLWTAARALAALEGRIPDAVTYDVSFRKPLVVPTQVAFASEPIDGGWRLAVRDPARGSPYVAGTVRS